VSLLKRAIEHLLDDSVTLLDDEEAHDRVGKARVTVQVARREILSIADETTDDDTAEALRRIAGPAKEQDDE